MKYLSYILLLIFIPMSIFSQNIWEMTNNNMEDIPIKIEVIDSNYINIFTITDAGGYRKRIINSEDQGKTWKWIYDEMDEGFPYDMSCPDKNTIYLGCYIGRIYKSTNNAQNFEIITLDTNDIYQVKHIKMLNRDIGVALNSAFYVTKDGWKTYKHEYYFRKNDSISYTFSHPFFKNDSIVNCIIGNSRGKSGAYYCEFNINTYEYKLYWITQRIGIDDMVIVDNQNVFFCGWSNTLNGGSCHDAIFKSTDSGKTWRRVLDLYTDIDKFPGYYPPPFGLQSIAFKDSMTGIAVGQFGKILYTYDGGESWIYESKLHDSIYQPPTMKVRYAGTMPIIADFDGEIFRLKEDNLAPKAEDTITISGRVWEGSRGQAGIPVRIGLRVTMTDSNGYYKFTRVAKGKHTVQAMNKYYDRNNPKYAYKPFDYTPAQYDLDLVSDTSGIDFNAIDLRTFYSVSGKILTKDGTGLKDIALSIDDSTSKSISDGSFIFPKIESNRTFELKPNNKQYKFSPSSYSINIKSDLDTFKFIATPITDVYEKHESGITLIPNPANDYIDIILDENIDIKAEELKIIDIFGKEQIAIKINNQLESYRVKLSNLSSGVYFIRIGSRVEKFVKL